MNHIDQLMNNTTMAPLYLKEGIYQPKNLSSHDSNILKSIAETSIRNIEATKGALIHLLDNIKMYQTCMQDAINLQSESIDIASKYASNQPQQSYTLPGIISLPSSYDLQSIKSDNERMEAIKDDRDKIMDQKGLYMKLMQQDFRLFLESYKRTCFSDTSFEEFVESLNSKINQAY